MPYAPTLTTFTDPAPCPRVEVFFSSFAPGTVSVTVYRSAAGREYEVRGAVRAATAGALSRIDFECPFNVVVTYRAEMFDAAGLSLGFTDPGTLGETVEGLPPEEDLVPADSLLPVETVTGSGLICADTWLHNPLDPAGAVKVRAEASTARMITRPVDGEISRPLGRRVGVVLSRGRQGVRDFTYDIYADDLVTADRVQALLGDYSRDLVPVVCLRVGGDESRMRIPKPLFLGVMNIVEEDVTVRWGGEVTIQRMTGDEVAPPVPGLFVPLLTNADLNAYYATNAALNSSYASNADVNRDYSLAGFSGGV